MKKEILFVLLTMLMVLLVGCSADKGESGAVEIRISAAASLSDALDDFKKSFEKDNADITLTFMYGGSGKLASQIEQGAPSDLFLSASEKDMDTLEEKDLIQKDTREDFTKNALVLIVNKDQKDFVTSFEEIDPSSIDHFAIGEPETVPVGRYTKEVFDHLNIWDPMQDKLVLASDVRQVLTQVELGNADYGVVYSSDSFISNKVQSVAEADESWHQPIVYPGAVLTDTEHAEEAQQVLNALLGDQGQEILANHGFR